MDDAIANTTMSTNDFEFLCVAVMLVAMVMDYHHPIPNRHSVPLCSSVSVDVVLNEHCHQGDDWPVDPNLDDLDNRDRRNRLEPRKKSKFHSYNNETWTEMKMNDVILECKWQCENSHSMIKNKYDIRWNSWYLPGERWVGALFHTLSPRFATKCRISCAFMKWTADRCAIIGISTWHITFDWSIEIHTDAVSCFTGVFISQRKNERWCFAYGVSCAARTNINASFRLTTWMWKINCIDIR